MAQVKCKFCKRRFFAVRPNMLYCSEECRRKANYKNAQRCNSQLLSELQVAKRKKEFKPKITIMQVTRFQTIYKEKTGIWLSYTEAVKELEELEKVDLLR